jgi:hypothetical protein
MGTWVDLDRLSPSVLRHLAAAKERASRPRYDDTEAMAEELAAMLMAGDRPTVGWYRRHRRSKTPTPPPRVLGHRTQQPR